MKTVCGDGLSTGISRADIAAANDPATVMPQCKDADGNIEWPFCKDKKYFRDEVSGKWRIQKMSADVCGADDFAICGDGLMATVDRAGKAERPVCKDVMGNDEQAYCEDGTKLTRDAKTGVWGDCGNKWKACGDGLNPGVSRDGLQPYSEECIGKDGKPEPVTCKKDGTF